MRISKIMTETNKKRPDGVVLSTLLQGTRGMLFVVFNWLLFIQFDRIRSVPGLDVMIILPPTVFFLIGLLDMFMMKMVWSGSLNGWRYGIAMSIIVLLMSPYLLLTSYPLTILTTIILSFAVAEIIILANRGTRQFYRA